ncbi:hypothetical protein MNBD_BACTEROID05-1212 [hydrothermal vent metagenome]|uniref:Glutathione S-transferase n=1 Tax=hydrothermal vent metagenome TaxID=652676 RepID=A0A3B0TJJ3_9ZZZZ
MLKVYGADLSSPANKVRFVANFLEMDYEYIRISLKNGEHKKEDYLKIHPAGKIPSIDDEGFTLFESDTICKYLASREKSSLYPTDIKQRAIVDQWVDFSTIHIGVAMGKVLFNKVFAPIVGVPVDEQSMNDGYMFLSRYLPVLEGVLGKNKYLASGCLSLADMTLLATLDPLEVSGVEFDTYKNICQWRNSLKKESFYTKCHNSYGEVLKRFKK